MIKKTIAISIAVIMLAAMASPSVAASGDIKPYKGWIGASSPLYGLKLYTQKLDESMSGSPKDKLNKQMFHAEERLQEAYAMALENNTGAMEAALEEYRNSLSDINSTMDDPEIDDKTYLELGPKLEKHEMHFKHMLNNSSIDPESMNRWMNAYNYSQKFKNGRPFMYCNDSLYFIPPGQIKKMSHNGALNGNGTDVPAGLAKKGYQGPAPTVIDGKVIWPWDEQGQQAGLEQYRNGTMNSTYSNENNYNYSYNESNFGPGPHNEKHGSGPKK